MLSFVLPKGDVHVLTEQRKQFINEFIKLRCSNATQAAINAGYSKKSAASQASQLLKDDKVREYLELQKEAIKSEIQQEFLFDALEARRVMYKILSDPEADDKNRLAVARDFLDRAGFKSPDKISLSTEMETEKTKLADLTAQLWGDPSE